MGNVDYDWEETAIVTVSAIGIGMVYLAISASVHTFADEVSGFALLTVELVALLFFLVSMVCFGVALVMVSRAIGRAVSGVVDRD